MRAAVAALQAQRFDGRARVHFRGRPLGGRHARDPPGAGPERPARPSPGQPGPAHPAGAQHRTGRARGRFVARMDAHTHYPPDYLARGVERLLRGDVAHVSGPQLPRATARGRAAWRWLSAHGLARAAPPSDTPPGRRSTWPAASPGSGCARRSRRTAAGTRAGLRTRTRAGRTHPRRGRPDRLRARDGGRVRPARQPEALARQYCVTALPGQDERPAPGEHAPPRMCCRPPWPPASWPRCCPGGSGGSAGAAPASTDWRLRSVP